MRISPSPGSIFLLKIRKLGQLYPPQKMVVTFLRFSVVVSIHKDVVNRYKFLSRSNKMIRLSLAKLQTIGLHRLFVKAKEPVTKVEFRILLPYLLALKSETSWKTLTKGSKKN